MAVRQPRPLRAAPLPRGADPCLPMLSSGLGLLHSVIFVFSSFLSARRGHLAPLCFVNHLLVSTKSPRTKQREGEREEHTHTQRECICVLSARQKSKRGTIRSALTARVSRSISILSACRASKTSQSAQTQTRTSKHTHTHSLRTSYTDPLWRTLVDPTFKLRASHQGPQRTLTYIAATLRAFY